MDQVVKAISNKNPDTKFAFCFDMCRDEKRGPDSPEEIVKEFVKISHHDSSKLKVGLTNSSYNCAPFN